MSLRRIVTTITFGLVVASVCGFAQQGTGDISGRVVNSRDSEPLALVQVELVGMSIRTVTAADGTFHLSAITPGNYVLQAATVGYYSNRVEFALVAGEAKIVEIVLTSSTGKRTDSVKVVPDVFDAASAHPMRGFCWKGRSTKRNVDHGTPIFERATSSTS